jgi:DNA-binding MarR family transcriptional regulator
MVVNTTNIEPMAQTPAAENDVRLKPSGWLLRAESDLANAINTHAVATTDYDATTLDLLVRLSQSSAKRMRGVELCGQLHKSPSHVSRLVDRAEAKGLVERVPDPDDRRAHLITLTAEGDAEVAEFLPHLNDVLQKVIFDTLSKDEIQTLIGLLSRISAAACDLQHNER